MSVQAINSANVNVNSKKNKKVNYVKTTGYLAAALAVGSGIAGGNKKIKLHKKLAYVAAALTALHIGIVEWFHCKKRNEVK